MPIHKDIIKISADPAVTVDELLKKASIPLLDLDAIHDDVRRLRGAGVDNKTLLNFAAARIVAANLIDDDLIEPLQQIRRIYSGEIAGRFFPPQMLSPRPDPAEIRAGALEWQKLIRSEEEKKKIQGARRRNSQRLAADASSLAYVQWLAERLDSEPPDGKPRQRVVFVTGDTLLFDAYRRWWVQNTDRVFALRRIAQYSPILNFKDAGSSIAFSRGLFENTRRAIEPQLVYFNLAEPAMDQASLAIGDDGRSAREIDAAMQSRALRRHGGREHLALLLKDKDPLESEAFRLFAQRVRDKVLGERKPDLSPIKKDWQDIERMAIGLYHKLITRRLDEEHRRQLRRFLAEPEGEGIDTFINDHLNDLYYHGAMLYVPEAFDALRRWARSPPATISTRAPIALRLRTSPSSGDSPSQSATSLDVAEMAMTLVRGTNVEDALHQSDEVWLRNPERLFALVSTVALLLSLWEQAAIYAQLAAGSHAAEAIKASVKRDDRAEYFELIYLRALANRFRIGAISHAAADSELRAQLALNSAQDDLAACIEYHANPAGDGERHLLRELRARSERAAIHGFYASWLLIHARRSGRISDDDFGAILQLCKLIHEDLLIATDMFAVTEARARILDAKLNTKRFIAFFSRVSTQVSINTAALYVFSELIRRQRQGSRDEVLLDRVLFVSAREVLKTKLANQGLSDRLPEVLCDVYLFLWLFGEDAESRKRLRSLFSASRDGMLNIDADLLAAYQEAFGSELLRQD
jgi:hypothetical protein